MSSKTKKDEELFNELRSILLEEDRKKIIALNEEITEQKKLSAHVNPLIDQKIEVLRQKFPEYFGDTITETIKVQIKESQDEVVEALYPIMGKLVKKFIRSEIAKLSEKINESVKKTFSFKGWVKRMKYKASGVSDGDAIIQDLVEPEIEEVFVVDKVSGLLRGSFSRGNVGDKDIVAGMLTAIKSFAEQAFSKAGEELEYIEYETFTLSLQNSKSFYIATAISGVVTEAYKDKLNDLVLDVTEQLVKISNDTNVDLLLRKQFEVGEALVSIAE